MFEKLTGRTPSYLDEERYRQYAVTAPFLPDTKEFLFEVRAKNLNRQPGEVCFPGGLIEKGEKPVEAALRETREELLVAQNQLSLTAPLDILATHYNTKIHPYLITLKDYQNTYNKDEVQEVFTVPFDFFLSTDPQIHYNRVTMTPEDPAVLEDLLGVKTYPWAESKYPVLFYRYQTRIIWGITARFVQNIVNLYKTT